MLENLYKTSATKRGTRVSYHVLIIVCVLKYSIKSHLKETTLNNNNCGIYLEYYIWTGSRYTSIPGFVCLNIRKCLLSFGLFFVRPALSNGVLAAAKEPTTLLLCTDASGHVGKKNSPRRKSSELFLKLLVAI